MTTPDYKAKAEEALEKYLEIVNDTEGWTKCQNVRQILISSKKSSSSPGSMFKAELEIDGPVDVVLHVWNPKPRGCRGDWDTGVSSVEGFQIIDDEIMLVRTLTPSAAMGLISAREFIDSVIQKRVPEKNMVIVGDQSVEHKDYPVTQDLVRGHNYPCGSTFTSIPGTPEKTKVVYLAHTNIGGDVPLSLTEAALPSSIHSMMDNVRKIVAEKMAAKDDDDDEGSAI